MYPNLEAELKRKNVKRDDLAALLGCARSTISAKLNGAYELTFGEAKKIKTFLNVNIPLEVLFDEEPDTAA